MATVAELARSEYQEVAYLLVIEGYPIAFTDHIELVGAGGSSWIGEDYGAREVVLGLEPPAEVRLGIGLAESGMITDDDAATFGLVDRDEHLIAYATDEAGTLVIERLAPTDDPAPETLQGDGEAVTIWGAWLNGEAIGPAGERRLYQVLPTAELPGYDHAAVNSAEAANYLRASTVQTAPRFAEGRLVALYVIRKDTVAGTWPSWGDQHASGHALIWWGSATSLTAHGPVWQLACEGPSSWLRRTLNANSIGEWQRVEPVLELLDGEDKLAVAFEYSSALFDATLGELCARSEYDALDTITSGNDPDVTALEIHTRLATVAGTMGIDAAFDAYQDGAFLVDWGRIQVRVNDHDLGGGSSQSLGAVVHLRMHQKVWLHLGFDLSKHVQGREPLAPLSTTFEVEARAGSTFVTSGWGFAPADPAPGYWTGIFRTLPVGLEWAASPADLDGNGKTRTYEPVYYPDPVALLYGSAQQSWLVGFDGPYLEGQLVAPPADKTIASGAVDRCGFVALRGSYKTSLDGDVKTRVQVARVSWRSIDEQVAVGGLQAVMWAEAWLSPRQFGVPQDGLSGVWAANDLEWRPLCLLGHEGGNANDYAQAVLLRLLLSTGTGKWSGVGNGATFTPGGNAIGSSNKANDSEVAALGLGIPGSMIDRDSFTAAAQALPGGEFGPLAQTRLAYVDAFDAAETIEQLIKPRGWCLSLRNGKYGVFARNRPLNEAAFYGEGIIKITQADIAGEPDEAPPSETVDFRPVAPIDLIEVTFNQNQIGEGDSLDGDDPGERTLQIKARDARAMQRRSNVVADIDGRSLTSVAAGKGPAWALDFSRLWGAELADWYARGHSLVTVRIKGCRASNMAGTLTLFPGQPVTYTSPWVATRQGSYGMTARIGRCVSTVRNLLTGDVTAELLLEPGDFESRRKFAPIARLLDDVATVEARHDAANRTFYCHAYAFGPAFAVDVFSFRKPDNMPGTDDALIFIWQSADGVTWEKTAECEFESRSVALNTITYKTATLTGTVWERRYTVLTFAPYEDQLDGSWPRYAFGVVCDHDNLFGAGDTPGFPWEV